MSDEKERTQPATGTRRQWASTVGAVHQIEARSPMVLRADDPEPPPGDGWRLVTSCVGPMLYGRMTLIWGWERDV